MEIIVGLGSIVIFVIFWYHISGIHKEARRSAQFLESISESIRMFEAHERIGK